MDYKEDEIEKLKIEIAQLKEKLRLYEISTKQDYIKFEKISDNYIKMKMRMDVYDTLYSA